MARGVARLAPPVVPGRGAGRPFATDHVRRTLKLTAAGAKAIAVDETGPSEGEAERRPDHPIISVDPKAKPGSDPAAAIDRSDSGVAPTPISPRGGTKIAQFIELLQRGDGASLAELIAATGWLPHIRLQGQARRHERDRPRAERSLCARGERPARGQPDARQCPAHRRRERRPSLGGTVRQARPITKEPPMRDRSVVRLSVTPSTKYSCSGSPVMLARIGLATQLRGRAPTSASDRLAQGPAFRPRRVL